MTTDSNPSATSPAELEQQRCEAVRAAFRPVVQAHADWQTLPTGTNCPRGLLVMIAAACLELIRRKDEFPQTFANAWVHILNLGQKAVDCLLGDRLAVTESGNPRPSFWTEWHNILAVLNQRPKKQLTKAQERFQRCLQEFEGDPRRDLFVAKEFSRWVDGEPVGPFFVNGAVDCRLIEKERANPGSVLADDFDPYAGRPVQVIELAPVPPRLVRSLEEALREEERAAKVDAEDSLLADDPASVEDLLRQGQNPVVIARVKRIPELEVLRLADELGIKPVFAADNFKAANILSADDQIYSNAMLGVVAGPDAIPEPASPPPAEVTQSSLRAVDGEELDAALSEMLDRNSQTSTFAAMRELKSRGLTAAGSLVGSRLVALRRAPAAK